MKVIIAIVFLVAIFETEGVGFQVQSICPTRQKCPKEKLICPSMHLIDRSPEGCCCKRVCAGQNEVYTCGCADKVCNEPQIYCIQCLDGCFCKQGYVRNHKNGVCILENQCPQVA